MTYKEFINVEFKPVLCEREKNPNNALSCFKLNVMPVIGNMELEAIHPLHIKKILESMYGRGLTPRSVVHIYVFMKLSFQLAISRGLIYRNPCIIYIHSKNGKIYRFPEDSETHRKIVSAIERLPLRNLYGFSYMTGFSISQLLLLHRDDYDRKSHLLTVNTERIKGKYLIPDCAIPYIEAELDKQDYLPVIEKNLLFVEESGKQINHARITLCTHIMKIILQKPDFTSKDIHKAYGNMLQLTQGDIWS